MMFASSGSLHGVLASHHKKEEHTLVPQIDCQPQQMKELLASPHFTEYSIPENVVDRVKNNNIYAIHKVF
jgi:hypothetical protein